MTTQAIMILMSWAKGVPRETQSRFATWFALKKESYAFDEALGAHFSSAPNIINSNMMKAMIDDFEKIK